MGMNILTLASLFQAASQPSMSFWDTNFGILMGAWLKVIGWSIAGGIGMGLGLIISLKLFTLLTRDVDEWGLVKANNVPIGIVLGCVILGTSLVIALCAKP